MGPTAQGLIRAACFNSTGESAVAVSRDCLLYWAESGWTRLPSTPALDLTRIRGISCVDSGALLAFGAGGLVGRLVPGTSFDGWVLPRSNITIYGAHVDPDGAVVTVVGEHRYDAPVHGDTRPTSTAAIAQLARGRTTVMADEISCGRLHAVTRLRGGAIVACGDFGAIARLERGGTTHCTSICAGHLQAIAALPNGSAVAVGSGGHAFSLSPDLEPQLEPAQTTRDLRALTVDSDGVAWAGSDRARILRRSAGSWARISGDLRVDSSVVALFAHTLAIRAICDDGAIIEGTAESR